MRRSGPILFIAVLVLAATDLAAQQLSYQPMPDPVGNVTARARGFDSIGCMADPTPETVSLDSDMFSSLPPQELIDCSAAGTSPPPDAAYSGMAQTTSVSHEEHCDGLGNVSRSTAQATHSARLEIARETLFLQVEGKSIFDHQATSSSLNCPCETSPIGCTTGAETVSRVSGGAAGPDAVIEIPFTLDQNVEVLVQSQLLLDLVQGFTGQASSDVGWELELEGVGVWEYGSIDETDGSASKCFPLPAGSYVFRTLHRNRASTTATNSMTCGDTTHFMSGEDCWDVRLDLLSCPADSDGDGMVGTTDYLALLAAWGPCPTSSPCPEDVDGDGTVDVEDFLALLAAWGDCPTCANL